jgi:hypothetical protein
VKEELLARLDALAVKLGTTTEYLWGVLIKQAKVEAITSIATTILFLLMVGACAVVGRHIYRATDWKRDDNGDAGVVTAACWAVGVPCLFAAILYAYMLPTLLLNPEYWALQEVIRYIGR